MSRALYGTGPCADPTTEALIAEAEEVLAKARAMLAVPELAAAVRYEPTHPLHVVEQLVTFMRPRLPTCDVCDTPDPSVRGGDTGPELCGTCRCRHVLGRLHDDDCREARGYCAGCVGVETGWPVEHTCGRGEWDMRDDPYPSTALGRP